MALFPTRITSRYEIKARIGSGGMGTLYLARDTNPNTLVAIKLLNADLDSGDLRERFSREAQSLAALNHPNIVVIYDSGEFEGSPFIVMEYLRGETLAEKIKRRAPMSLSTKLKLMGELCEGLAHAHDAGIIHRDIKPANLMVDLHGRLKILDFGIARGVENSSTRMSVQLTQVNVQIGTPGYMSPEQIEGAEIDRRSDLFTAGAVCYELLSYRVAFPGATTRQIEKKVLHEDPMPLSSAIPGIDPEIDTVIRRALAKDVRDRYQDAATFGRALDELRLRLVRVEDEPARHTPPPPGGAQGPAGSDRRSRRARAADQAYQRALASQQEGAPDFARRSALEALAEDPEHEGARALLTSLGAFADVERWLPSAPTPSTPAPGERTLVDSPIDATVIDRTKPSATAIDELRIDPTRIDATLIDRAAPRAQRPLRPWRRYIPAIAVAALLVVVAGVWMVVRLLPSPGPLLTITRPTGGTIVGGSLRCGTTAGSCSANRATGELVELQAEPDPGFVFGGFTGDCADTGRTLMTESRTCGATFAKDLTPPPPPVSRVLTITRPKGGTILGPGIKCGTLGSSCVIEHPDGAQVLLTYQSDNGFAFQAFTGDCAPSGATMMAGTRNCGATFVASTVSGGGDNRPALPDRTLTVSPPTGGTIVGAGINCGTAGSNCSVVHPNGIAIQLTAMPDPSFTFSGFTGDCGSDGKIVMNGPRSCGATFAARADSGGGSRPEHTLTIIKPQGGTIEGAGLSCGTSGSDCSVSLANATAVRLDARADTGYSFDGFTGDCASSGTTTMSQSRTCGGKFSPRATIAGPPRDPKARQTWTNPVAEVVMVWIDTSSTGGRFMMSSPPTEAGRNSANEGAGQFERRLGSFWIDQTEVTRKAFRHFVEGTGKSLQGPDFQGDDRLPVVKVTWQEARSFCEWAGSRLPTEPEWEYVARAGSQRRYPWGNDAFNDAYANAGDTVLPVGTKPANNFGVVDMIGNVWEWTSSLFRPYPYDPSSEDATAPGDRVIRGGAFGQNKDFLRIASRFRAPATTRSDQGGFRCVR